MKRGMIVGIVVIVILIILGFYFLNSDNKSSDDPLQPSPNPNNPVPNPPNQKVCGEQGDTIDFSDPDSPNECCEGLDNVNVQDSFSVADKCYSTGTESGLPVMTCSDCGNGICEEVESVCGCWEDCKGKGLSTYDTVQDFLDEGSDKYCNHLEYAPPDLYGLCHELGCIKAGEAFNSLDPDTPNECCEGLSRSDHCDYRISIGDTCYTPPTIGGVGCTSLGCTDCGNGSCDENEDICSCPEDCVGKTDSDYTTSEDFCVSRDYEVFCEGVTGADTNELCVLC